MKILMLNYEFPPLGGGAGNANEFILEEFSRRDIQVDLVTSSPEGYREENFSENITIYREDVGKKERHNWRQIELIRYMVKGFLRARKLQKKNDYVLVHAWSGFPCGFMARFLNLPYLVALRGGDIPGFVERFSWQYIFLEPIVKNVWKSADSVVPNSRGLKRMAQETLDVDMSVIPNGVDTEKFQAEQSEGDQLQLLCVSRLTERKRVQDVLEAVEGLEGVELTVIGEGRKKESLQDFARELGVEDKVEFVGYVPHDEMPERYRIADVFVMPSLKEGMSNALLEAAASGLPVITTETGGTEEIVGDNGVIVPKKDPDAIEEAIVMYREKPELMREQGRRSRQRAEEMTWGDVAEQYIEEYREIEGK